MSNYLSSSKSIPSVSGMFISAGTYNGQTYYKNGSWLLWTDGVLWFISTALGVKNGWQGASVSGSFSTSQSSIYSGSVTISVFSDPNQIVGQNQNENTTSCVGQSSLVTKTSAGQVKMRCMIWEPQPVVQRPVQECLFSYNYHTLQAFKDLPKTISYHFQSPQSIHLAEKYVPRDTLMMKTGFDTIPLDFDGTLPWGSSVNSSTPVANSTSPGGVQASLTQSLSKGYGTPLIKPSVVTQLTDAELEAALAASTGSGVEISAQALQNAKTQSTFEIAAKTGAWKPNIPWVHHQTFKKCVTVFDSGQNIVDPKWSHMRVTCPNDTNGVNAASKDSCKNAGKDDFSNFKGVGRRGFRWVPRVCNTGDLPYAPKASASGTTSTTSSGVTTTSKSTPAVPGTGSTNTVEAFIFTGNETVNPNIKSSLHWMVEKVEPLFRGEDFWIDFIKPTIDYDQSTSQHLKFKSDYYYLDPQSKDSWKSLGVLEKDKDGNISESEKATMDISLQPYYIIEIGCGDPDHNYFIIMAYNHKPVFVHAGKFPYLVDGSGGNTGRPQQMENADVKISRKLSTYNVSCRKLMESDRLLVTVRNDMGRIVVVFKGEENNPWTIERWDYDKDKFDAEANKVSSEIPVKFVPMIVADAPIRIGGGYVQGAFMFGPLSYAPLATIQHPHSISIKGPVELKDVNFLLRGKDNQFFQDAEMMIEMQGGASKYYPKISDNGRAAGLNKSSIPRDILNAIKGYSPTAKVDPLKRYSITDVSQISGAEGKLAYLAIYPRPGASPVLKSFQSPEQITNSKTKYMGMKYIDVNYELRAGDFIVGKESNETDDKKWCIANCITPIGNGWRLFVDKSIETHNQCPVDVSHHVQNFSAQWQFSDNIKIQHSGTIKFLINLGKMTSSGTQETAVNINGLSSNGKASCHKSISVEYVDGETKPIITDDPSLIDQSHFLAKLVDKTFFIRVYAWWEDGFMDCNVNSDRKCQKNVPREQDAIFTGLCHGGVVHVAGQQQRTLDCQLEDYWKILQDSQFLNSPYFDGVRDFNAIYQILNLAGFADTVDTKSRNTPDYHPPASFMSILANSDMGAVTCMFNGEKFYVTDYALPSSFDILQSPLIKPTDGSKFDETIVKIASYSGKMVYFDRFGVFKMTLRPDQYFCMPKLMQEPKCRFFASPLSLQMYGKPSAYDLLSINPHSYKRAVADVPNEIQVITATPNGELLMQSSVNLPGKFDPTSEGYVGYTKRLLQMDGIFGSEKALKTLVKYYTGFYKPPVIVNWESFGFGNIMAGDTVTFTGLEDDDAFPPETRDPGQITGQVKKKTVTVYLTSVGLEIDAKAKTWFNKYEGEWIYFGDVACSQNPKQG